MDNQFRGETWKTVVIKQQVNADQRLEVSNYGRVRTFNKISKGKIIKGSIINGYPIIKLKVFLTRSKQVEMELLNLREQIRDLQNKIHSMQDEKVVEAETFLATLKNELNIKTEADLKQRSINYQSLVHRLVAEYFLPQPRKEQTIVAHLDFNKMNNYFRNLKWMTIEESMIHQQKGPHSVLRESNMKTSKANKLTVTRVMFLKKLLGEDKPIKSLAKQFKITETQVLRIKRGENWGKIEAAQ
jgi:hypothetical protein